MRDTASNCSTILRMRRASRFRSVLIVASSGASSRALNIATGVRSSCAALAVKRRKVMAPSSRRCSASFSAFASGWNSSGHSSAGRRWWSELRSIRVTPSANS